MYEKIIKEVDGYIRLEKGEKPTLSTDDEKVQKQLKIRHNAIIEVFHDNLIVSMLRNAKTNMAQMNMRDDLQSVYRLSVIDLFVEKAIVILEREAGNYQNYGKYLIGFAALPIIFGIFIAFCQLNPGILPSYTKEVIQLTHESDINKTEKYIELYQQEINGTKMTIIDSNLSHANQAFVQSLIDREVALSWKEVLANFVKSFTFYGLLVLSAVILKRFGKAMLDQSERLYNRRHALREGRLYLHLQNGIVETVEEFDKVFNWNATQNNAFADIPTDAQAPWGTALKEALNIIPKTVEASKSR